MARLQFVPVMHGLQPKMLESSVAGKSICLVAQARIRPRVRQGAVELVFELDQSALGGTWG